MNAIIEFKNVTKEYVTGKHVLKAVNKLNFEINEGEFVVILGPSGSGKSTLLNLLGGLDSVSSGDIIINNKNIANFNDNELTKFRANEVGFIFQFYNLIPSLTVYENIDLISELIDDDIDVDYALNQVGLLDHSNQFPSELSGGEQQRVSIARAVIKKPTLLLCDEPTGALDSKTGYNVIKILHDLSLVNNTTVVVVTHNEKIAEIANKIIYLNDGIIEDVKIIDNPKTPEEVDWKF
ncbi:macrolide ABC transporter ATP-binding protein [Methanobrevibacter sp. 87.7]|uniref:ABC transporter ATP-binding protein n=1 Tax=Methanobrevibacter sp. 87.7 TaxID=387957 RepID=UPI000B50D448|nr:ABC transporter ATP-binding protein [Methanobrevibacter sp. 87.7]OWT32540.1 macrolide ABC transporter ATP-binding protein [Methanobrevibacter sp. 87.7]